MRDIAQAIRTLIDDTAARLIAIRPESVSTRATPTSWSKQEILGHLIDSATNNHQRFVRAAGNPTAITAHVYDQNAWVRVQQHNSQQWPALIELWSAYNRHLCHVIEQIPAEALAARCDIGAAELVSLEWVISDYLRHLRHHVGELLDETG